MSKTTKSTKTAQQAYAEAQAKILAQLARLTSKATAGFHDKNEKVHWGHVGDLNHYVELLTRMTDAAFKEGEHAE